MPTAIAERFKISGDLRRFNLRPQTAMRVRQDIGPIETLAPEIKDGTLPTISRVLELQLQHDCLTHTYITSIQKIEKTEGLIAIRSGVLKGLEAQPQTMDIQLVAANVKESIERKQQDLSRLQEEIRDLPRQIQDLKINIATELAQRVEVAAPVEPAPPIMPEVKFEIGGLTGKGGRPDKDNEDYIITFKLDEYRDVVVVCDGVSRSAFGNGKEAARFVAENMKKSMVEEDLSLLHALALANRRLYRNNMCNKRNEHVSNYKRKPGGTTTLVAMLIDRRNNKLSGVACGDSRLKAGNAGEESWNLTSDRSLEWKVGFEEVVDGKKVRVEPLTYTLPLSQADLSKFDERLGPLEIPNTPDVIGLKLDQDFDYFEIPLEPSPQGSTAILYSDGLINKTREDQVAEIIGQNFASMQDLSKALYDKAMADRSEDNISVIAVRLPYRIKCEEGRYYRDALKTLAEEEISLLPAYAKEEEAVMVAGGAEGKLLDPNSNLAFISSKGYRQEGNEDGIYVDLVAKKIVIADGAGGHEAGEVASQVTLQAARHVWLNDIHLKEAVPLAETELQGRDFGANERGEQNRVGATVAGFEIKNGKFLAAYRGDSRIYRVREGRLELLTTDQHGATQAYMMEKGLGDSAFVQIPPERLEEYYEYTRLKPKNKKEKVRLPDGTEVEIQNVLYGCVSNRPLPSDHWMIKTVEVPETDVKKGDRYLLVTDGVGELPFEIFERIVTANKPVHEIVRDLHNAVRFISTDNITIGMLDIAHNSLPPPLPAQPDEDQVRAVTDSLVLDERPIGPGRPQGFDYVDNPLLRKKIRCQVISSDRIVAEPRYRSLREGLVRMLAKYAWFNPEADERQFTVEFAADFDFDFVVQNQQAFLSVLEMSLPTSLNGDKGKIKHIRLSLELRLGYLYLIPTVVEREA